MNRTNLRWFLRLLMLVSIAWLSGCSTIRLAYDNADIWIRWRADHYLDPRGEQRVALNARVAELLSWHRQDTLPRYASYLEEAARRLADGLTRQDLVWAYETARTHLRQDVLAAGAKAGDMLRALDADQIAHLERRFAEDNQKFAREYISGSEEKRREKRAERNAERIEDWYGRLTDEQTERVRRHSDEQPLIDELRDRERKRLQTEFLSLARQRKGPDDLAALLLQLIPGGGDPKYVAATQVYLDSYMELLVDVSRMATVRQRQRAVARLQGYARDLTQLHFARKTGQAQH